MQPIRVVNVTSAAVEADGKPYLCALCDDGVISWFDPQDSKWKAIPQIMEDTPSRQRGQRP